MRVDLWVKGGTVVTPEGRLRADLLVRDEKVFAIMAPPADGAVEASRVIDASGKMVLPGIIDPHVHFNEPGKDWREDFASGTMAAAIGGVTTAIEMPNSLPPCHSPEIFDARVEKGEEKCYVDYALYGAAGATNLRSIEALAHRGVIGYKTFMTQPTKEREAEFVGLNVNGSTELLDVFKAIAPTGLVSAVHAESSDILRKLTERLRSKGRKDFMAFAESRPEVAELEATAVVLELARDAGCRVQLCHVSSPRAVKMAWRERQDGLAVTVESCPHYLTFTEEALRKYGPYAKIAPPLRSQRHVDELWDLVRGGFVDMLGTDHAPYVLEEKEAGMEDIFNGSSGVAYIEASLPLMLTHVSEGRLSLEQLVNLMCEGPARVFGLYPKKGLIAPGSDADLVVVDMGAEKTLDSSKFVTGGRAAARLLDGMQVKGLPVATVVRGSVIMENGIVTGKKGWGTLQRPLCR